MVVYAAGGGGVEYTGVHLFHVKGTTPLNTRAVEGASPSLTALSFILSAPSCRYPSRVSHAVA